VAAGTFSNREPTRDARVGLASTARRRLALDRAAATSIRVGGLAVIVSIAGIFAFLVAEILPVFRPARIALTSATPLSGAPVQALLIDEHKTHEALLGDDGALRVVRREDARPVLEHALGPLAAVASDPEDRALAGMTRGGAVTIVPIRFAAGFEGEQRVVTPAFGEPIQLDLDAAGGALGAPLAIRAAAAATAAAAARGDAGIALALRTSESNAFTGETTVSLEHRALATPGRVTALAFDSQQRNLYAGLEDGSLLRFDLQGATEPEVVSAGASPIRSLALLIGGGTLAVGQDDGSLSTWFRVPSDAAPPRLTRIRDFPRSGGAVQQISPSQRDRSFLAASADGTLGLHHATSGRTLWNGPSPGGVATALSLAPKGNAAVLATPDRLATLDVQSSHPEISPASLFGKVWYEGAPEPEWVWQSSSGDDAFEPKLSLVPLLYGTLKGTFYALLLAVPLGVLGAMYTSQFMHPKLQRWVKPGVEIMAALPSVVLGFLAGLWLAPRVERLFPAFLAMGVAVPLAAFAGGWLWARVPKRWVARLPDGSEMLWIAAVVALVMAGCVAAATPLEAALFGGSFPAWLERTTGLGFDQRNAVVVGIAMGFAVIPIIFAISEDAFTNVPRELAAVSLALGANRWQTVVRVVLPTASPGIFSAIMVGFGRAVGETMIVLMATGNTPIMDWSPFNGFRTLSANIAVEIPEAPHGGTLYRTLFLAALLLFAMTFLVNTAAELVRDRLRRRFGRL
jgi:phosphate transport system permease protein